MKNNHIPTRWKNSKISTIILTVFIFGATCFSDTLIVNSLLTLPLIISTLLVGIISKWSVPKLSSLNISQLIRKEGPKSHQEKSGTPTMGGLIIIPIGIITGSLISFSGESSAKVIALACITLTYMIIGGIDDLKSLQQQTNKGLTAKKKLILQGLSALIFLSWCSINGWITSNIALPFNHSIDIGLLIWPLAFFVILAESNATNLTDGLDGLASGCGCLVFTGLAIQLMLRGNSGDPVIAGFSICMAGASLGFLFENRNPANIFMGDTGSLAMGAALSGIAILSNSLWPLLLMGGVLVAESCSVIIQVFVFKITKKLFGKGRRVFLMAPLHHHFELDGVNEQVIVNYFWLVTSILVVLGLVMRP